MHWDTRVSINLLFRSLLYLEQKNEAVNKPDIQTQSRTREHDWLLRDCSWNKHLQKKYLKNVFGDSI